MNDWNEKPKILVVDDHPQNIQILGVMLRDKGFSIHIAENGVQALERVENVHPDLILLDIMMPEMDGFEACERLKANPDTRDIPVIFLTARTEIDDVIHGFDLGAVDYVTKPFNLAELLVRINTHLTLRHTQQSLAHRVDEIARMKREHEAFLRHELKNRITPIQGYSDLLKYDDENLNAHQKEWISIINNGAENMVGLIDSMKKLQDLEAGTIKIKRELVQLDALINDIVIELGTVYGERVSVSFENDLRGNQIEGDANLLSGVFQNLIKNGIEHVMDLSEESERVVSVRLFTENKQAVVAVQNGGTPISPDALDSFFEKFNTQGKQGGTGLGTTYAFWVTRAHGGAISVASDDEHGTTVTVRLPQE